VFDATYREFLKRHRRRCAVATRCYCRVQWTGDFRVVQLPTAVVYDWLLNVETGRNAQTAIIRDFVAYG
jgi:hypothetical protein